MKKLLSLLTALLFVGSMLADTATFSWAQEGGTMTTPTGTQGQITLTGAANSSSGAPVVTSYTLRLYQHKADGDGASATLTAASGYRITAFTVTSPGGHTVLKYDIDGAGSYTEFSWSGTPKVASVGNLTANSFTLKNCQNSGSSNTTAQIASVVVTYESTGGTPTCDKPTFSPTAGAVLSGTTVEISTTTEDATIHYTVDGTVPTTGSATYSTPIAITEAKTIKAIAVKDGYNNSSVATAAYTIATPLTTMQDIFNAATTTSTPKYITFSDSWVVTGVSTDSKNVYITDGTKGMILFNNSANMGLVVGNTLSGTVQCSLKLNNGAARLENFTTDGLTKGIASVPAVQELDADGIAALRGVNTGSLIKISGVCTKESSKYYIAGVQLYNTLFAFTNPTEYTTYDCTGVYVQYNSTKEVAPRSAEDLEESAVQIPVVVLNPTSKYIYTPENVENQSVALATYSFANPINSVTAVLYSDAECNTEITSGEWVKDITVNGDKTAVTFNVDDNNGLKRQCYMKITASDGTSNASAVLPITQVKTTGPANLPFAFDGGRDDIESTIGLSQNALGTDYGTSPKLKFDDQDDYLILRINEAPGELTFSIKGNAYSAGEFKVQTSTDGTEYTDLATYTSEITSTAKNIKIEDISSEARFIKWIYTTKTTGNVALGNIALAKPSATALDNTTAEQKVVKTLQNGMLIIEKAGVRYNVMGQIIR